jgi:type I restriction enzyme R subunit
VAHFVGRGYNGKAMVVSVDKKTAVRMYTKVKDEWERYLAKLRMDLSRAKDEREQAKIEEQLEKHQHVDMAVVVSQSQNEVDDLKKFEIDMKPLRERMIKGIDGHPMEEVFKNPDSNLRIVFVCAMWMTGFDVPNLSTLYLDKPLKNHTLMQAIARANRVAEGKKNGVIVDYIGVFKNIEKALAIYASSGTGTEIIRNKDELIEDLKNLLAKTKECLIEEGVDLAVLLKVPSEQKLLLLDKYTNALLANMEKKKQFLNLAADLYSAYSSVLPNPEAEDYYEEVTTIRVLASRLRNAGEDIDVSQVKKDLEDLLDKSIQTGEYMIPQKRRKIKDLSMLDANALKDFFEKLENKNTQVEGMKAELEEKITEMVRKNKKRSKFMERLNKLLDLYNSGAHDIDRLFDELVDLAKELNEEDQRATKEHLTEEELAVFDLLMKENLNPKEVDIVKKAAKDLLKKLKTERLVLDWRETDIGRAGVKTEIFKVLYAELPEPTYTEQD